MQNRYNCHSNLMQWSSEHAVQYATIRHPDLGQSLCTRKCVLYTCTRTGHVHVIVHIRIYKEYVHVKRLQKICKDIHIVLVMVWTNLRVCTCDISWSS